MQTDLPVDGEAMANRFHRLMGSFIRNDLRRAVFQQWEMALLIDIASCQITQRVTMRMLGEYRKAGQRRLADSGGVPMLLSEYLEGRRQIRRKVALETESPSLESKA